MVLNFANSTELLQSATKNKLYGKMVAQLQKDFGLANIPMEFSSNSDPITLKTILHEKIYVLILEKFSDYLNLLYIVDVPEKSFKDIKVTDVVEIAEQVSFLILKRELQKVWLKQKYSGS
ncbi:hypothetical protein [uncultured Kriegella sp.]|uniref:hypothetical protein n=1 Tax=uncultured Kriegella sp. TaxID=1798910 RepID=UPI0030DBAA1F|tara:strand:+ start:173157 stop:173516 length:360 start_codon:yes stop_codon:yes gene_type:complete